LQFDETKTDRLIRLLPTQLENVRHPKAAIRTIARELRAVIPSLWRATLNKLVKDSSQVELVAVWSDRKTQLKPGMRVSTLVTAIPEVLTLKRPVVGTEHRGEISELKRTLLAEGTRSWTVIPLAEGSRVVGVLTLSSRDDHVFTTDDLAFYESLGRAVQVPLVDLISRG
jgi:transcriptional regulator with GAF, ATPase, and Fis domain